MASEPGRDWSGRELAGRLGIRLQVMLTQLAQWTCLGLLAKTGRGAATRSLLPTQPGRNPDVTNAG